MEQLPDEIDLMHRRFSGLEVFLMWHRETNLVSIAINDMQENHSQAFPVPADKAMDAFTHPFAYAPREART